MTKRENRDQEADDGRRLMITTMRTSVYYTLSSTHRACRAFRRRDKYNKQLPLHSSTLINFIYTST